MIKIVRNNAGNCINFVGSSNPTYWNACLSAELNATNSNNINIKNDIRSVIGGETVYEFFNIPYTSFADKDGNAFSTAQECMDYIDAQANVAGNTGRFILEANDTIDFNIDDTGTTILLDNGDTYAVNSIQASANDDGHININTHEGDIIIYKDLRIANTTIDGTAVNATLATAVNELNSLFTQTASTGSIPVITSTLTPSITVGDTLNYEATATDGVAYEWSNLPAGITTVDGNNRKLIGGSQLTAGTYNITLKAINYYGVDTQTVVLTVSNPPFADTKSVKFPTSNDYLTYYNAGQTHFTGFQKAHNGNASDWSIGLWFKTGTNSNTAQTIFSIASHSNTWDNYIELRWTGSALNERKLDLIINDASQAGGQGRLRLQTPNTSANASRWYHITITNNGTSYTSSGHGIKIYIDGVLQTLSVHTQQNGGVTTGTLDAYYLHVGKSAGSTSNWLRGSQVNELALWNSELSSSDVTDLYNSGSSFDLTTMTNSPDHWYRMGDGDTFPTLSDNISIANLTMTNMTVSDIVSDTQ